MLAGFFVLKGRIFSKKNFANSKMKFTFASRLKQNDDLKFLLSSVGLEHMTVNHGVLGSSPRGGAKKHWRRRRCFFCVLSSVGLAHPDG